MWPLIVFTSALLEATLLSSMLPLLVSAETSPVVLATRTLSFTELAVTRPRAPSTVTCPMMDVARIVPLLVEQVTAPVRWIECVEELVRQGVTRLVEVGPGKVLSGLARRIDKGVEVWNVEDGASLEKTLAALAA